MPSIVIRDEHLGDFAAIENIIKDAFAPHPLSSHDEHLIVENLRKAKALTLSLVAEQAGLIKGYVALSPITITDGSIGWYGLGPLAVAPLYQGQGIGRKLVENAIFRLRLAKAGGCAVLGAPDFYGRFGFAHHPALILPGFPAQFFLSFAFGSLSATGEVSYHPAFHR